MNILKKVIEQAVQQRGRTPSLLAVFDLDSTLYNVTPRTERILKDFSKLPHIQKKFPKEAEVLSSIQAYDSDWGIKQILLRAQLSSTLDFFEILRDFWKEKFFSNEYLQHDLPYEGAVEYVTNLYKSGAEIIYLTARDVINMKDGTIKSLVQHGFPIDQTNVTLMMKPARSISDEDYKASVFNDLYNPNRITWYFENEAYIIEQVRKVHKHINIIFMDSVHSGRTISPSDLPTIKKSFR